MKRAAALLLALSACRDFEYALEVCVASGTCTVDGGSGGGGGGGASTGGGGATGGGTATGGGGTATGGGAATGGGGTATGGGTVNPEEWNLIIPATIAAAPGTSVATDLEVTRPPFNSDQVELFVELPDGGPIALQASFELNGSQVTDTNVLIWAPLDWDAGAIPFSVAVYDEASGTLRARGQSQLVYRAPRPTLVVDDDAVGSNQPTQPRYSAEDRAYIEVLTARGIAFDRMVMPYLTDGGEMTPALINNYQNVIWYLGGTWSSLYAFTRQNETVVAQFLDRPGKRFLMVSEAYLYSVGATSWNSTSSAFVSRYLGGRGHLYESVVAIRRFQGPGVAVPYGDSTFSTQVNFLNPKPETQVLFTEVTPDSGYPVATRYVTDAGSISVFCGFGHDDVRNPDAGGTRRAVIHALLDAGGFQ